MLERLKKRDDERDDEREGSSLNDDEPHTPTLGRQIFSEKETPVPAENGRL